MNNILDNFFNGKKSPVKQIIIYPHSHNNSNKMPQILKLMKNSDNSDLSSQFNNNNNNNNNNNHHINVIANVRASGHSHGHGDCHTECPLPPQSQSQSRSQLNQQQFQSQPTANSSINFSRISDIGSLIDESKGIENSIILQFVNKLKSKNVKVACFDFDDTIVDQRYNKEFNDPVNISKRVSPLFLKLVIYLIENGIFVTITTFNGNPKISEALSRTCGYKIPVYFRWDHNLGTGKMWHIQESLNYANNKLKLNPHQGQGLRTSNVVLFDDNPTNQIIARNMGCEIIDNKNVITLDDLLKFILN